MRIPIVDEEDNIIGYKDRKNGDPKDICRVTALWVKDKEGNILLAQRAFHKEHSPGKWGPAVAGTVEEGETYESNVVKEAVEEIGLKNINPTSLYKIRNSTSHEYFCQAFTETVDHDYPFKKEDNEVAELRWFSKEEVLSLVKEKPELFIESFSSHMEKLFNINKS